MTIKATEREITELVDGLIESLFTFPPNNPVPVWVNGVDERDMPAQLALAPLDLDGVMHLKGLIDDLRVQRAHAEKMVEAILKSSPVSKPPPGEDERLESVLQQLSNASAGADEAYKILESLMAERRLARLGLARGDALLLTDEYCHVTGKTFVPGYRNYLNHTERLYDFTISEDGEGYLQLGYEFRDEWTGTSGQPCPLEVVQRMKQAKIDLDKLGFYDYQPIDVTDEFIEKMQSLLDADDEKSRSSLKERLADYPRLYVAQWYGPDSDGSYTVNLTADSSRNGEFVAKQVPASLIRYFTLPIPF